MAQDPQTRLDINIIRGLLTRIYERLAKIEADINRLHEARDFISSQIRQFHEWKLAEKKKQLENERMRLKTLASGGGGADEIGRVVSNCEKIERDIEEMINEEKQEATK